MAIYYFYNIDLRLLCVDTRYGGASTIPVHVSFQNILKSNFRFKFQPSTAAEEIDKRATFNEALMFIQCSTCQKP